MKAPARRSAGRSPRRPSVEQIRALAKFRHALRRFLAFSEARTKSAGVTPQQYEALIAIKAHAGGEVSISDLADELLLLHNGAVQLADRMVAANLARRRSSTKDRRLAILTLTSKGEATFAALTSAHLEKLADGYAEWAHLSHLIGKVSGR